MTVVLATSSCKLIRFQGTIARRQELHVDSEQFQYTSGKRVLCSGPLAPVVY
jgi:hypothetical protein